MDRFLPLDFPFVHVIYRGIRFHFYLPLCSLKTCPRY
jgi:hypothetical protein